MDLNVTTGPIPLDRARRAAPQVYEWLRERIPAYLPPFILAPQRAVVLQR
jgi:hypothetical protein